MKGDFTRFTFDPKRRYSGVLMQQGRVQADADWNEQQALTRYRTETGAVDLIGCCGGPIKNAAFGVITDATSLGDNDYAKLQAWCQAQQISIGDQKTYQLNGDFILTAGRFYVDGILCESDNPVLYSLQPDLTQPVLKDADVYAVYLDVWHRHVTALDDDHIREKALGGPDTASRAKVVWQVKTKRLSELNLSPDSSDSFPPQSSPPAEQIQILKVQPHKTDPGTGSTDTASTANCDNVCAALKAALIGTPGTMAAQAQPLVKMTTPCQLPPSAGYLRLENQLYRVEIHKGGTTNSDGGGDAVTFKWSRDNGTVVTKICDLTTDGTSGATITVKSLGPDDVLGFATGQWVEVIDDDLELSGQPGFLLQIAGFNGNKIKASGKITYTFDQSLNPKLRRWDQASTTADLSQGVALTKDWLAIEGGVQVQFAAGKYNTGDYWLIPARTATADIEWPVIMDNSGKTRPASVPALGIKHHYSCLAILTVKTEPYANIDGIQNPPISLTATAEDCRCLFPTLCQLQEAADERKPCVKVVGVNYGGDLASYLVNGATISLDKLLHFGIGIRCDHGVSKDSIVPATAFVTLELPFPAMLFAGMSSVFSQAQMGAFFKIGGQSVTSGDRYPDLGYQPLILPGQPYADEVKSQIVWKPLEKAIKHLQNFLRPLLSSPVLTRLTLKGNFIWSNSDPDMYLDGEAFGATDGSFPNHLKLPSGDGRRGGDFEMYFFVGLMDSPDSNLSTNTVKIHRYIVGKNATLKHEFPSRLTTNAFKQKFGSDALAGGGTVADALSLLPGNQSFSSVNDFANAMAKVEASSLQSSQGTAATLRRALGTANVSEKIGNVAVRFLKAAPESVRNGLGNAGISTLNDLASASPSAIQRAASTLAASGVSVTAADIAGYAGLAKILINLS